MKGYLLNSVLLKHNKKYLLRASFVVFFLLDAEQSTLLALGFDPVTSSRRPGICNERRARAGWSDGCIAQWMSLRDRIMT